MEGEGGVDGIDDGQRLGGGGRGKGERLILKTMRRRRRKKKRVGGRETGRVSLYTKQCKMGLKKGDHHLVFSHKGNQPVKADEISVAKDIFKHKNQHFKNTQFPCKL